MPSEIEEEDEEIQKIVYKPEAVPAQVQTDFRYFSSIETQTFIPVDSKKQIYQRSLEERSITIEDKA